MSFFPIPVRTQTPIATVPYRQPYMQRLWAIVPATGGDGNVIMTVPYGFVRRVLCYQMFAQYDSTVDNNQYVTYGIDAMTDTGLVNVFSLYDLEYLAPTTVYRLSAFYGADTSFRDVPTAAGITQRSQTRPIPDWWLPEGSRAYIGYHNFNANDDGTFAIVYEEMKI